ncbi:hypothetical protein JCM3766R1_006482 [Sporobolomyces carnicolor]
MLAVTATERATALARPASQLLAGRTIAIRGSHESITGPDPHDLIGKHGGASCKIVRGNPAVKIVILSPHKWVRQGSSCSDAVVEWIRSGNERCAQDEDQRIALVPLEFLLRSILDGKLASIEDYDFELRELDGLPPFVGNLPQYIDPIVPAQAPSTSKVTGEGQGKAESISDAEAETKPEGNQGRST